MPQLTPEQQDAVEEAISRQLYRINRVVKSMFGQDLSDDEIRQAHQRVRQGVDQSMKQAEQRKTYTPLGGEPNIPNIPQEQLQDGGFINEGGR